MPELSVHDNAVLSIHIDCVQKRIVFQTEYERNKPPHEFTSIVFENVMAYHFEGDNFGSILFDVEEMPLDRVLFKWRDVVMA